MINQLLPEALVYLTNINSQQWGAEYKLWRNSQIYGFAETQCFLKLLSALLERNAPKVEVAAYSRTTSTSRSSQGSRSESMVFSQRYM